MLSATGATVLPSKVVIKASIDASFKHLFHVSPVLDRGDFRTDSPPIFLLRALCLVGSMLRQLRPSVSMGNSQDMFIKVR
jgi:hypothetical protein